MRATKVQRKNFTFKFPVTQKKVQDLKLVTETIGELTVSGIAYFDPSVSAISEDAFSKRYGVDIDFVTWNGADVKGLLDVTADTTMADIEDAAIRIASEMFNTSTAAA